MQSKLMIMKKLLLSLLLFPVLLNAQDTIPDLPTRDGKVFYSGVVTVDSTTANVLYERAYGWFVDTYNSAQDVIQMSDKDTGIIVGKGGFDQLFSAFAAAFVHIEMTVKIQVKDGRYKYEITDFRSDNTPYEVWLEQTGKMLAKKAAKMSEELNSHVLGLINSLTKKMATVEEEW